MGGDEIKGRVKWTGGGTQFIGRIDGDNCAVILGGDGGISPMRLLLMSVAGCTAYDVVMILQKMREPIENLEVEISGGGEAGGAPEDIQEGSHSLQDIR